MSGPIPTLATGGIYKIISVIAGSVVTLSTADGATINGYRDGDQDNQKWLAENIGGDKWTLKSLHRHNGKDVFLSYPANSAEGTFATGGAEVRPWDITQWGTRGGAEYRVWVPGGTGLVLDLLNWDPSDGAKVQLWKTHDSTAQFWLFQRI